MGRHQRADCFLRWQGGNANVRPRRGSAEVAYLTLVSEGIDDDIPQRCVDGLRARGYTSVVTAALAPAEAGPFLDAGFTIRERLDLLAHDMVDVPATRRSTRRFKRGDLAGVLLVDHMAFTDEWQLDAPAFQDAVAATPTARVRIIEHGSDIAGYSITGRVGRRGYVQRVAVHPNLHRQGWGRELVADSLGWLRRRGVTRTMVNTQLDNDAARQLYLRCGFELMPVGLCVLERDL